MNTEPWALVLKAQKWECWCTFLIGYQVRGWDTRVLATGWCLGAPLRLRLGLRLSQMMADDWVVPLAPLMLSVIILNKAVPWTLIVTSGGKNRYYSLCEWYSWGMVVTLPDQHLTRPCFAECILVIALGSVVGGVDSSVQV